VEDVKTELDLGRDLKFLDVRESAELEVSRLPEVIHIPLGEVPDRLSELDPSADWIVVCRSGGRSGQAAQFLLGQGFPKVRNMDGGMNAWASRIDSSLAVY
jgi:rhodanese-related sulfurtransferase